MRDDADAFLRLALVPGLGPLTAQHLLEGVDKPADIFEIGMHRLQRINGVGPKRAHALINPQGWNQVDDERATCFANGITILTRDHADYPRFLNKLNDPPLAIWVKGDILKRDELSLAVVGPRRPSAYGHRIAGQFCRQLSQIGITIVSGLAKGIDTIAHESAIKSGGRTLAVLGSGFGHLYPRDNEALADSIINGQGAVLTEYPYNTSPSPGTFPRRNRIVAAMSLATLVVEASQKSGSLITARLTGEIGQDILALPGPVDRPEHQGSNQLIRDGATLITSVEDILEEIPPFATIAAASPTNPDPESNRPKLNHRERAIYNLLTDDARSVDELSRVSDLPASATSATLISLEIRKLARKAPGGYVKAC